MYFLYVLRLPCVCVCTVNTILICVQSTFGVVARFFCYPMSATLWVLWVVGTRWCGVVVIGAVFFAVAVLAANVNRNPVFEWATEMRDLNALNFKCECVWVLRARHMIDDGGDHVWMSA